MGDNPRYHRELFVLKDRHKRWDKSILIKTGNLTCMSTYFPLTIQNPLEKNLLVLKISIPFDRPNLIIPYFPMRIFSGLISKTPQIRIGNRIHLDKHTSRKKIPIQIDDILFKFCWSIPTDEWLVSYANNSKHCKVDRHTTKNSCVRKWNSRLSGLLQLLQSRVEFFPFAFVDIIPLPVHIPVVNRSVVHHGKIRKDGEYSDVYNRSIC